MVTIGCLVVHHRMSGSTNLNGVCHDCPPDGQRFDNQKNIKKVLDTQRAKSGRLRTIGISMTVAGLPFRGIPGAINPNRGEGVTNDFR